MSGRAKQPLKVLIVEDSEDDTELLVLELDRAGYDLSYERVDNAVRRSIQDYMSGRFAGGAQSFGLKEGGLDYAINVYNRKHLGDIPDTLDEIKSQIISGAIKVPDTPPKG